MCVGGREDVRGRGQEAGGRSREGKIKSGEGRTGKERASGRDRREGTAYWYIRPSTFYTNIVSYISTLTLDFFGIMHLRHTMYMIV